MVVWYNDAPVGRDPLNDLMKILSVDAELSEIYTNYSIRSACLTILDEKDLASRHMQALSGPKSEVALKTYAKRSPPAKKRHMFNKWTNHPIPHLHQHQKKTEPTSTILKPNVDAGGDNQEEILNVDFLDFVPIENNVEDFDLVEILSSINENEKTQSTDKQKDVNALVPKPNTATEGTVELPASQNIFQNITNNMQTVHTFEP